MDQALLDGLALDALSVEEDDQAASGLEQRPIGLNRFAVPPVGHQLLQQRCFQSTTFRSA